MVNTGSGDLVAIIFQDVQFSQCDVEQQRRKEARRINSARGKIQVQLPPEAVEEHQHGSEIQQREKAAFLVAHGERIFAALRFQHSDFHEKKDNDKGKEQGGREECESRSDNQNHGLQMQQPVVPDIHIRMFLRRCEKAFAAVVTQKNRLGSEAVSGLLKDIFYQRYMWYFL